MKTKRAFLIAPGKFELREVDINPDPGQILVKVAACGVCNWEMNHWKGLLGECPQTLGHEWGGTVAALGEGITDIAVGDGVTGFAVDGMDDFRRAIALLNKGTFKMDGIISHIFSLDEIQKAFETCESKPRDYIKGVVKP